LTAALVEFHKTVAPIHKTAQAHHHKYADLSTVLSVILPALSEQGIRLSQTLQPWGEDGTGMMLVTSLKHVSGEEEVSRCPLIAASSSRGNPLHDWGSAVTYQRRYAILSIVGLAAGINDDDAEAFSASTSSGVSSTSNLKKGAPVKASNGHAKPAPAPAQPAGLDAAELERIKKAIVALSPDDRSALVAAFRRQFNTPDNQGIADYIKTAEHADFLTLHLTHAAGVN
jgi:hypothetical protein